MLKLGKAVHVHRSPVDIRNGKWHYETGEYEVRIMAIAEGYAMVRRPRAMPYVCSVKELRQKEK